MTLEIEERLERAAELLPRPADEPAARARDAALRALPPSRRRRRVLVSIPAVAVAVAVAAAVAFALGAPWRDSPLATERALAALGEGPVLHVVLEDPRAYVTDVDIASDKDVAVPMRTEYWYDAPAQALRMRLSVGGEPLPGAEFVHTPDGFFTDLGRRDAGVPRPNPVFEQFAKGYRDALERGEAERAGEDVVLGHDAVILRVSGRSPYEVAVDAHDYRPLAFRFASNRMAWAEAPRVVVARTIARDPSDFARPKAEGPRPERITGNEERTLSPAQAADALGTSAIWPGPSVSGVELSKLELVRVTTDWTDGSQTRAPSLSFQYGASLRDAHVHGHRSLLISEGRSIETALPGGHSATPPEGRLRLTGAGGGDGQVDVWFGQMKRDGVYLSFRSSDRDLIIAAARAMRPLG